MLALRSVSLALRNGAELVKPFSLDVAAGGIVTLMGPSGSGKSSLLSFIGGDLPDAFSASGDVTLNGQRLNGVPPEARRVARLFQDDLLFPHMTVGENILFALAAGQRAERVKAMRQALADAGLDGHDARAPHTLSGGQRARVALLRALAAKPAAILLDEPFSRLDADLKTQIRQLTFTEIAARGIPALLVTHDRSDAPSGGRVLRIGPAGEVKDV